MAMLRAAEMGILILVQVFCRLSGVTPPRLPAVFSLDATSSMS
jgi:hypothetical protein